MRAIMVAVFACGMAGCVADPASVPGDPADPSTQQVQSELDSASQDRSTQQANPDEPAASDLLTLASQDCVFIRWCDEPNSTNGTVCVVRSTSTCQSQCVNGVSQAIINECIADANAVCGGVVKNARIFCN